MPPPRKIRAITSETEHAPAPIRPLTPREAFAVLLAGNERFVAGDPEHANQDARRRTRMFPGQSPLAVLFGCADSRLAAEFIFDRSLGDLFVVRTAGHVLGPDVLGNIEYGVSALGCPLVVVLGHDSCGAIAATRTALAEGTTATGFVQGLIDHVAPSVLAAQAAGCTADADYIAEHVRHTATQLLSRSPTLSDAVTSGRTAVVGMAYRLTDGTAHLVTAHGLDAPDGSRIGGSGDGRRR